jgi:glycosyltransferase involved in cell wall biosynthesis
MNQNQTTVIVPAYNEERGLPVVLGRIFEILDDSYEVIVIDDGSTDRTSEVASQFRCRLVRHEVNQGKGAALKTGIENATGENIIWIDADDTYPVELIPKMAEAFNSYDMVVCSRKYGRGNIPRFNRIRNWLFRTMIGNIYGFKPYDPCTGLYGARKSCLELMNLSSKRFAIEPEISIKGSRMKLKMLEIPIEYRARVGSAKLSGIRVGFEDVGTILKFTFWKGPTGKIKSEEAAEKRKSL